MRPARRWSVSSRLPPVSSRARCSSLVLRSRGVDPGSMCTCLETEKKRIKSIKLYWSWGGGGGVKSYSPIPFYRRALRNLSLCIRPFDDGSTRWTNLRRYSVPGKSQGLYWRPSIPTWELPEDRAMFVLVYRIVYIYIRRYSSVRVST